MVQKRKYRSGWHIAALQKNHPVAQAARPPETKTPRRELAQEEKLKSETPSEQPRKPETKTHPRGIGPSLAAVHEKKVAAVGQKLERQTPRIKSYTPNGKPEPKQLSKEDIWGIVSIGLGVLGVLAGVASVAISFLSSALPILSIVAVFIGLLALPMFIAGLIIGALHREVSFYAKVGYIINLVLLIFLALSVLATIVFIILLFLLLASLLGA